jgi:rRNA maturation RNase YbeY
VLSFAELAAEGEGAPDIRRGEAFAARDLWRPAWEAAAEAEVGEIVIAPAFVGARCREAGWSFAAELAMLTAHGVLHLLGWEHDDQAQARAMRARERELLARLGIAHPLASEGSETD